MRALLTRFMDSTSGSAFGTYMVFTACWLLIVAAGVHFATPTLTAKLVTTGKVMTDQFGSYR